MFLGGRLVEADLRGRAEGKQGPRCRVVEETGQQAAILLREVEIDQLVLRREASLVE